MIIPVGFAQVNFRFTGNGAPLGAEVTQGLELASFPSPDPDGVADALADAWTTNIIPVQGDGVTLVEVTCKFGPNDTGPTGFVTRNTSGAVAEPSVTPNTAVLVRKTTAVGGRRGRGRLYIPGIPEGVVTNSGDLMTSTLNDWQVALNGFDADIRTAGLIPVVLHAPGISSTPAPSQMTNFVVQTRVGTQRDRMRR